VSKTPFIWLGAGRAGKRGVGRYGLLMDKVARAQLPVPEGAILLDDLFRIYLNEGIVELAGDRVVVPDPVWLFEVLYRDVRFPHLHAPVDVRALPGDEAFAGADMPVTLSGVDSEDAQQLAGALSQAWTIYGDQGERRRDVLVTKTVAVNARGQAISREDELEDETVVAERDTAVLHLPRLRSMQRPSAELPPHLGRLQMLLRGLRRSLGKGDWTVEWADDGEICWLLQVY
jgi:cation transport regulator ChaB